MPEPVVDPQYVDLHRLSDWMDVQGLPKGDIENAQRLAGGTQNILLRFQRGGEDYVLRRPPEHLRKNSNETMRREARVLAAIAGSEVPHPALIAACPEEDVIGASFYLMQPIDGFNPSTGLPEYHRSSPEIRHAMGLSMVDAIAALGRVDYKKVGLEGFGKPDTFLERQVPRWLAHLKTYDDFENYPGPDIPGLDEVGAWLEANRPSEWTPGVIHGDFHLSNVMFRPDSPDLAAVVDWELSTLGDPVLDLGWLMATWPDDSGASISSVMVQPWDGFPTISELIERYRQGTTRDLSAIGWYGVMACYKLGIILEGTHARACAGKAPKPIGDRLHASTVSLFDRASRMIAKS